MSFRPYSGAQDDFPESHSDYTLGLLSPIVSNTCHVGGLLVGLALGGILPSVLLTDRRELAAGPTTRLLTALAFAALLVTSLFFLPHLA
jgi:hypothetical protein